MYESSTEVTESHRVAVTEIKRKWDAMDAMATGEMGWVGGKKKRMER